MLTGTVCLIARKYNPSMPLIFFFQYLNSTDYDGRKSEEVGKLELTILQLKKVGTIVILQ